MFKGISVLFLFAFILSAFFSLANTSFLSKSLETIATKWVKYIFFYLVVVYAVRKGISYKIIFLFMVLSAALIGVDSAYQFFTGVDFLRGNHLVVSPFYKNARLITASLSHPNGLAAFFLIPIYLVFFGVMYFSKKPYKILAGLLTLFFIVILFLTFSRGGWMGFAVSLPFAVYTIRTRIQTDNLARLFCGMMLLMLFYLLLVSYHAGVLNREALFNASRLSLWENAAVFVKAHPIIGIGVGTFMDVSGQLGFSMQYLHNSYYQILVEQGIFGLASFILFLVFVLKDAAKIEPQTDDFFPTALFFGVLAFLAHSFLDNQLYSLRLSYLFWGSMGLLSGLHAKTLNDACKEPRR